MRRLTITRLIAVILAAGLLGTSSAGAATTWYVATNGSDTDPGTEAKPLKTAQRAFDHAAAEDTIHLNAGTYDLAGLSATIDKPLTLIGEDRDTTVLTNGHTLTFSKSVTVKNLKFSGGPVLRLAPAKGEVLEGVLIENCIFEKCWAGVYARYYDGVITNVTISNCDFRNIEGGKAIAIGLGTSVDDDSGKRRGVSNVKIANNSFRNLKSTKKACMAVYLGDRATTQNVAITGNYFENIIGPTTVVDGAGPEVHAVLAYGANLNISYNTVKNMNPGTDHEAVYMKADNSTMANNVMIDCTSHQGAFAIKGQKSHHNTVEKNRVLSKQGGIGIYTAGGKYVTFKDNFVKIEGGDWGIGLYVYEINLTPAIITGNYSEARRLALYMRGAKDSKISGNTLIAREGRAGQPVKIVDSPSTKKSNNVERTGRPNDPPVAAASADRACGHAPLTVDFSSAGSKDPNGRIVSYEWDFHDGTSSSKPDPRHTYDSPRTYAATLIVTDKDGVKDMAYVIIRVTAGAKQVLAPIGHSTYRRSPSGWHWLCQCAGGHWRKLTCSDESSRASTLAVPVLLGRGRLFGRGSRD